MNKNMNNKTLVTDLCDLEILPSWYEDIDSIKERIKALRRHLRQVEKERKEQPPLIFSSPLTGKVIVATSYRIIRIDAEGRCQIMAERKRPYVESEWD
jgi:hypothetical protein